MFNQDRAGILDALKTIDRSESSDAVISAFMAFVEPLGFTSFLISQLANPLRSEFRSAMTYTNWPTDLVESRFKKVGMIHDPIVQYGIRSRHPFAWSQAIEHASRFGRGLAKEARDHMITDGYMFPMRKPGSPDGGVSIGAEFIDISTADLADLELAAMHTYYRLEALHPPQPANDVRPLSPQEIDVLQFAAAGKSIWDISMIMSISESAVKDATKRARTKLNAVNTCHACTTAISRDLILP